MKVMKNNTWLELKEKIRNPPPERLAAIEYKSHFMQMMGITVVCVILITRGLWYIVFAFIFGLGVSYSQGITAYQKYQLIKSMTSLEQIENIRSPTRRRGRIVNEIFGKWGISLSSLFSVLATVIISKLYYSDVHFLVYSLLFVITLTFLYVLIYYFPCFWIADYVYKKRKEVNENAKKEERTNGRT